MPEVTELGAMTVKEFCTKYRIGTTKSADPDRWDNYLPSTTDGDAIAGTAEVLQGEVPGLERVRVCRPHAATNSNYSGGPGGEGRSRRPPRREAAIGPSKMTYQSPRLRRVISGGPTAPGGSGEWRPVR